MNGFASMKNCPGVPQCFSGFSLFSMFSLIFMNM